MRGNCDKEFSSFILFRSWAYENGFSETAEVLRIDEQALFSQGNCRVAWGKVLTDDLRYDMARWDRFVDKVRQGLRLKPIITTDPCLGCPKARRCEEADTVCRTRLRYWDVKMEKLRKGGAK